MSLIAVLIRTKGAVTFLGADTPADRPTASGVAPEAGHVRQAGACNRGEPLDHLCRHCLARVDARPDGRARCRSCGAEGATPEPICCCGVRRGRFDKLRCVRLDPPIGGASMGVTEIEAGLTAAAPRPGWMCQNSRWRSGSPPI